MINIYLMSNCEFIKKGIEYAFKDFGLKNKQKINMVNELTSAEKSNHKDEVFVDYVLLAFKGSEKNIKRSILDFKKIDITNDCILIKQARSKSNIVSRFDSNTFFTLDLGAFTKIETFHDDIKTVFFGLGIMEKSKSLRNLTTRELQTLNYHCKGFSSKNIGKLLSISTKTVSCHRRNALKKMIMSNYKKVKGSLGSNI